jgi:hypothetical protein
MWDTLWPASAKFILHLLVVPQEYPVWSRSGGGTKPHSLKTRSPSLTTRSKSFPLAPWSPPAEPSEGHQAHTCDAVSTEAFTFWKDGNHRPTPLSHPITPLNYETGPKHTRALCSEFWLLIPSVFLWRWLFLPSDFMSHAGDETRNKATWNHWQECTHHKGNRKFPGTMRHRFQLMVLDTQIPRQQKLEVGGVWLACVWLQTASGDSGKQHVCVCHTRFSSVVLSTRSQTNPVSSLSSILGGVWSYARAG